MDEYLQYLTLATHPKLCGLDRVWVLEITPSLKQLCMDIFSRNSADLCCAQQEVLC